MTLLELLRAVEWGGKANPIHHQCPICGELRMTGHLTGCEMDLYLKAASTRPEPLSDDGVA